VHFPEIIEQKTGPKLRLSVSAANSAYQVEPDGHQGRQQGDVHDQPSRWLVLDVAPKIRDEPHGSQASGACRGEVNRFGRKSLYYGGVGRPSPASSLGMH
jgi:hypothetical protein